MIIYRSLAEIHSVVWQRITTRQIDSKGRFEIASIYSPDDLDGSLKWISRVHIATTTENGEKGGWRLLKSGV